MEPLVLLLRRFAVDFLTGHNLQVCREIMSAQYVLTIGGIELRGRDDTYLPATLEQLSQFPGLALTVHDVVLAPNHAALRFSEHGASMRHGGAVAAWSGIVLFESDGRVLVSARAEEDYYGRRRQLATGRCARLEPPHPAPWDLPVVPPDPSTTSIVRDWLRSGCALDKRPALDGHEHLREPSRLLDVEDIQINDLFSAGSRAAFHASYRGRYRGGLQAGASSVKNPASLHVAGIADVRDGRVLTWRVVCDRAGLQRALRSVTP